MKSQSMYRYTPLLISISLFIFTGCSQPIQKTSINPDEITTDRLSTITVRQAERALNIIEETLDSIDKTDNNETQLKEAKKNLSNLKEWYNSNGMRIGKDQDKKLIINLEDANVALSKANFASAEISFKASEDILKNPQKELSNGTPNIAPQEIEGIRAQIQELQKAQNSITVLRKEIPFPLALAKVFGLIGFISLVIAVAALSRVKKQRDKVKEIMATCKNLQSEIKGLKNNLENNENDIDRELRPTIRDQNNRIEELERAQKLLDTNKLGSSIPLPTREVISFTPPIQPSQPIEPKGPSKSGLIAALNNGDRQQLREAALSELNITSESDNAIITGRSTNTDLEVVPGGGSYLLLMLQDQPWLFPTEKTLKGFTAVQTSKGIFGCEQQTIASPQLLEPALLEGSGSRWTVIKIGRIAIP